MSVKRFDVAGSSGYAAERDEGDFVRFEDYERLAKALREIAAGEGYYGAQAREYKEIARAALRR